MGRKFTLGLSQLKLGPSRSDDKVTKSIPNALSASSGSPPSSPYPGRRPPLSTLLESELRFACAGVLQNTKPSHIIVADQSRGPKPQLDYAAIKKSTTRSPGDAAQAVGDRHSPHHLNQDLHDAAEPRTTVRKYSYKPDTALEDLFPAGDSTHEFVQANINRRDETPVIAVPLQHRRTKSARSLGQTIAVNTEDRVKDSKRTGSQETSGSTPQTDITEYPWSVSTAPTSAGITPARASKRASAHVQVEQEPSSKSDSSAIEWMRKELDKRRKQQQKQQQQQQQQQQPPPSHCRQPSQTEKPDSRPPSRPPSRARSIRDGIKEYIRPSTAGSISREPSRPPSRSASRASHRTGVSERERSPSTRGGWRSWGSSRKDETKGDLSRSSSRGRSENRKGGSSKHEVNLNRELPPLPSLKTWNDPEPQKPNHVANMRSPTLHSKPSITQDRRDLVSAANVVSEKDRVVVARLGIPIKVKPEVYQPTRPNKPVSKHGLLAVSPATVTARTTDVDYDGRIRDRDFTPDDLVPPTDNTEFWSHGRSKSANSNGHPELSSVLRDAPAPQASFDHYPGGHGRNQSMNYSRVKTPLGAPNGKLELASSVPSFSQHRKYDKADIPPALNSNISNRNMQKLDSRYRRAAEMNSFSPPPVPPKDDKKSWWHIKSKQKKPATWMDQLEKMGIKDGVLVNDDVAGSPVIRY
ncbi:hypothetical protein MBLNU459_g7452t1 [Dothideomycetes sp. NU459]